MNKKTKKVYTLTFQFARNYGAILQAYALYDYLKDSDCEVKVIDYWPHYANANFKWYSGFISNPSIKSLLLLPNFYRSNRVFNKFKSDYLSLTKKCVKKEDIESLPPADVVFVGSDQVWNSELIGGIDDIYFLNFKTDSLKASYAASAGEDYIPSSIISTYFDYINKLDFVSVREDSFCKVIQDMGAKEIKHCLDPVFLLDQNKYKDISKISKTGRYILTYYSDNLGLTDALALKISDDNGGIPVYKIGKYRSNGRIKGIKVPSVEEFLGLIKNAEFVVTPSFHGTAFSIIFRKQFFSIAAGNRSSRIISLLNAFNLQSRFISEYSDIIDISNKRIDYSRSEDLIESKVNESKKYINNILNNV